MGASFHIRDGEFIPLDVGVCDNLVILDFIRVRIFFREEVPDRFSDNRIPSKPDKFLECLVAVVVDPPGIAVEDGCGDGVHECLDIVHLLL